MRYQMIACILALLAVVFLTAAQENVVAPRPAAGAAYAKYKNRFYVLGGLTNFDPNNRKNFTVTGQFFALDLSKPWKSQSPAWIQLPDGPKKDGFTAAISLDGKTMIAFPGLGFDETSQLYSFDNNTWSQSKFPWTAILSEIAPITLEPDGTILIVGGFSTNNSMSRDKFEIYSFEEDRILSVTPVPPYGTNGVNYLPARYEYKVGWSKYLSSAVFYGGSATSTLTTLPDTWVTLYDPVTKQWKPMMTYGVNKNSSYAHCMAITDDGKTLLSYGGRKDINTTSDLFILDLMTGVWTKGRDSGAPRALTTCTVAGDHFLVWGGENPYLYTFDEGKTSTPVLIYQISTGAWIQEYKPSKEYLEPTTTSPSLPSSTSISSTSPSGSTGTGNPTIEKNLNIGAIAGGAAGAVVLIGIAGFLVWRRRRQRTEPKRQQNDQESKVHSHGSSPQGIHPDTWNEYHKHREFGSNNYPLPPGTHRLQRTSSSSEVVRSPQDAAGYGFAESDAYARRGGHNNKEDGHAAHYIPSSTSMPASMPDSKTNSLQGTNASATGGHVGDRPPHKVLIPSAFRPSSRSSPHTLMPSSSPRTYIPPPPISSVGQSLPNVRHPQGIEYGNPQALKYSASSQQMMKNFQGTGEEWIDDRIARTRRRR